MCRDKMDEGLGFRGLFVFNQALLAKQGLRLEKNLDSLAARVLKGSYYPTSTFMKADEYVSGSMMWKTLCWGCALLDKGSRMRVGPGSSILIFQDKWIPRPITFKVFTPK
ncbi:hypothetical protein Dsin_012965 [Dipteronia sinensis]|uniref:Uncharacterized protein n=1 Tax=Dipteronia sinensis TaxID=43782 RepID=A0AAE0EA50_9ROSI|nr:hypothetical protein Dsin_012965 [Dipteronia sinensis]